MIKLKVFNMERFLETVNECIGSVMMIDSDGRKQDINRQFEIQSDLRCRHSDNGHCLTLTLDISNPKDYLKVIYFTIEDC